MTTIDFTKAIQDGTISFEQACALQGTDMTSAIKEGIVDFEEACKLMGMAEEVSLKPEKAPKQEKARKPRRKTSKKKAPEPEVKKSKTGEDYHTPKKHSLTNYQVKRLDNAVLKLWEAGFENAEWRVQGTWAWIYAMGEKGTGYSPAFKAAVNKAFKGSKWGYSERRGAAFYKDFIK